MKKLKQTKGITLVALVVTIIILLILAAISIQALTNQGLFGRANDAKRESEIASIKEQIALDIYEKQLEPPVGSITEEQLETILEKHGTIIYEEDGVTIKGITTAKGYEILLKDIYGGETVAESIPDGATVTPVNDITTWLKTGGISNQYSYTTIEQVIADSTCTESLMNNENAMKYIARSTEFADAICESESTMTYLGQSAYVDDTVLNSDIWKQKIKASQYWSLVYQTKQVTVYGGAYETIAIEGYYNSPFITNADGSCSHEVPIDTITLKGNVSGKSFTRTVTNETTDVYVMPEGALYWYGNECVDKTGGWTYSYNSTYNGIPFFITNNKIDISTYSKMGMSGWDSTGKDTIQSRIVGVIDKSKPSASDSYAYSDFSFIIKKLGGSANNLVTVYSEDLSDTNESYHISCQLPDNNFTYYGRKETDNLYLYASYYPAHQHYYAIWLE